MFAIAQDGQFINVDRLDLKKYAKRPALAKALVDYMLYHDHNPKKVVLIVPFAVFCVASKTSLFSLYL